ncbi:hypothetical protein GCM10009660_06620 [Catellatospora bangladeshensis]
MARKGVQPSWDGSGGAPRPPSPVRGPGRSGNRSGPPGRPAWTYQHSPVPPARNTAGPAAAAREPPGDARADPAPAAGDQGDPLRTPRAHPDRSVR